MGWFRKEEENFDDSSAFESDKGAMIKIFFIGLFAIVLTIIIIGVGYNQYEKWKNETNETSNETYNETLNKTINQNEEGKIIVNFTDFNLTVDENPDGIYYYTTQEKVTGENCYINGKNKSCSSLTNSICSEKECRKDLITITECFINNKKIDCPEELIK